jgi:hypothetical protein
MNTLMTIDEVVKSLTADIKQAAQDLGIHEAAVAIVFGTMCGAPITDESLEWAAGEISKAAKEQP